MLDKIIPLWYWYLYKSTLLAVVLLLVSFGPSVLSANVDLDALIDQVNEEQQEDAEAKAAEAERQRQLDAAAESKRKEEMEAAAERRRKAEEERRRREEAAAEARRQRLENAELKRIWDEFTDALYTDIGFSWNMGIDNTNAETGLIYYNLSTRYYIEFGYQSAIGLGFRLIHTESDYFVGEDSIYEDEESDDTASSSGQGYGIHLNLLCCLTLGLNKIGLSESLQFDGVELYNPGVITETVLGLHSPINEDWLIGFEYVRMSEEEDQLRDNSSGLSLLWVRYRFGN